MEEDLMDELYGDLHDEPSDCMQHDEESVDIYSGLENSPVVRAKVNPILSPRTLESMDMYEELIKEEQEEKEATYNELKQKFEAAQKQVKELLTKLQLVQTKNSSLLNENTLLKKNICSLIKTARMEIVRKDEEISRLSNRSGRGSYGQNFRRPQMEVGQANPRHISNNVTSSAVDSRNCRQDNVMNEVNQRKERNAMSGQCAYPAATSTAAPQPFEVLQKCPRTNLESPLHREKNSSAVRSDSETQAIQLEQESGHVHPNSSAGSTKNHICNSGPRVPDKTADSSLGSVDEKKSCPSKQVDKIEKHQKGKSSDMECNSKEKEVPQRSERRVDGNSSKSERTERELRKDSTVASENKPEVPVTLKSSEKSKSPPSQLHKTLLSEVSSHSSKTLDSAAEMHPQMQSKKNLHYQDTDRTSRGTKHSGSKNTTCTVLDDTNRSQNHKTEKRDASNHQRKEERRQGECSTVEKRSNRTDRHKEHEHKRSKESDRSKRDEGSGSSKERRSNRSDSGKEYERRSAKERDRSSKKEADNKVEDKSLREGRSRKQDSSPSKHADSQKNDAYKGRTSSTVSEPLLHGKRSHSHENSRKMEDFMCSNKNASSNKYRAKEKGVDKDRERKRGSQCDEQSVQKEEKIKNVGTKDDRKNTSPANHIIIREGQPSKNDQEKHLESVPTESPSETAIDSNPCKTTEDCSPDRKLSFMETLNLTLSPLKKQKQSSDPKETIDATSEDASAEKSGLSDLGEEFFVIDELQNSQDSVEEIDKDSQPKTAVKQHDLTVSGKQSEKADDPFIAVASEEPSAEDVEEMVLEKNVIECQEAEDSAAAIISTPEKTSDSNMMDKDSKLNLSKESQKNSIEDFTEIIDNPVPSNSVPTKTLELTDTVNASDSVTDDCEEQGSFATVSKETSQMSIEKESQDLQPVQDKSCKEDVSSSDKMHCNLKSNTSSESSVAMEVTSSTLSADLDDQINTSCDVSQVSTSKQDSERACDTSDNLKIAEKSQTSENLNIAENTQQSLLRGETTTATSDSSTVSEEMASSKQAEPDSTENEEQNLKLSSTVVISHDEDSMMLTLRNLQAIPEAVSPLTSPIRQVKKVQPHHAEKQPHVKSLNKDLSTAAIASSKDEVNMDMNKENKRPDSSVTPTSHKGTKDALSASATEDDELEDGEIVSESEEERTLFIQTPPREKDKSSGTCSGPRLSGVGKRISQKKSHVPTKYSGHSRSSVIAASNVSPTASKRRFKTVSPPLKTAVYTLDEFVDMLTAIRAELRKKYMKLHKNVTKTAFCCIVDMSHASFTEFVDTVDLDKLCCQGNDIKVKLNKIISSIMSNVTKNGIVKRIFEQRAGDLKQKLWTFVDGQFDFLFKELKAALESVSKPSKNKCSSENKNAPLGKEVESKVVEKEISSTSVHRAKKAKVEMPNCTTKISSNNLTRRGLGSRGKNIKAVMQEDDELTEVKMSHQLPASSSPEKSVHESTTGSDNKISSYVRRLSHNGSIQDFEILTEQQASSLTFNLVSDSQMGEIFRCLLQGSDLLEPTIPGGDNQSWPVGTPRKEGLQGESLIGIITPNKTTPSKFITSWSAISPYKFDSHHKMLLDPAILDESCLLEVPSNSTQCQIPPRSVITPLKSYSILAEDLAVSLTIPSPLKSDSHLSFLHPGTGVPLSTPESVLSAHYSEDALLDGEDATEQDIHLSLDTDNSSCESSPSRTWEGSDPPGFQFRPNLPMQAVVMERSNDHFIVRIRHTSTSPAESHQNEEKSESALSEVPEPCVEPNPTLTHEILAAPGDASNKSPVQTPKSPKCDFSNEAIEAQPSNQKSPSEGVCDDSSTNNAKQLSKESCVTLLEESSVPETRTTGEKVSRKRKEHHSEPKAKRSKMEESQDKHHRSRHKKRSKSSNKDKCSKPATQVSPSSLSAKNVIRKKGEVVVTWTRDEDRDILIELKMKGASPKTFAALSKKLKKSTEQIEERFTQLMKLFKKKEKMEN